MITKEQVLVNKVTPDLPIVVYPERDVLPKLRETFMDESINLKTALEIHSMMDLGDEGGLGCEICIIGMTKEEAGAQFLSSITHFKIKRGERHYQDLEKYRIKRIRKLSRQNRNRFGF